MKLVILMLVGACSLGLSACNSMPLPRERFGENAGRVPAQSPPPAPQPEPLPAPKG